MPVLLGNMTQKKSDTIGNRYEIRISGIEWGENPPFQTVRTRKSKLI